MNLPADTLVDGELVALGSDSRCSFNALQHSRFTHIQFYAFDLLVYCGQSVIRLPIEERRKLLTKGMTEVKDPVFRSTPYKRRPADLIAAAKELDLEGIVAKRKGSIYEPAAMTNSSALLTGF